MRSTFTKKKEVYGKNCQHKRKKVLSEEGRWEGSEENGWNEYKRNGKQRKRVTMQTKKRIDLLTIKLDVKQRMGWKTVFSSADETKENERFV